MTEMIKVKRVEGRDLLTEDGHEWPQGTVSVEKTHYIRRRLNDGDLIEVSGKSKGGAAIAGGAATAAADTSSSSKGDK